MPSGDRTGPMGQGSMTGRGFGFCSGNDIPGFENGFGRGMGRGFGYGRGRNFGRGFGWRHYSSRFVPNYFSGYLPEATLTREDEVKMLKSQAAALNRSQESIEKRIADLEKVKE